MVGRLEMYWCCSLVPWDVMTTKNRDQSQRHMHAHANDSRLMDRRPGDMVVRRSFLGERGIWNEYTGMTGKTNTQPYHTNDSSPTSRDRGGPCPGDVHLRSASRPRRDQFCTNSSAQAGLQSEYGSAASGQQNRRPQAFSSKRCQTEPALPTHSKRATCFNQRIQEQARATIITQKYVRHFGMPSRDLASSPGNILWLK